MYVCIVHVRLPVLARRCCEAMSGGLTLSKSQPAGYLSHRGAHRWLTAGVKFYECFLVCTASCLSL